jgi:type I restriction enzyme S subunit
MDQWIEVKIGEIIKEMPKSQIQVGESAEYGVYPFFTSGTEVKRYNDFLVDGKYLFLSTGGNAQVSYYDGKASYSTDTYCLTTIKDDPRFIYYILLLNIHKIDSKFFIGSGLKHLQKKDFQEFIIYKPKDRDEQSKITEILSTIDDSIQQTEKLIAKYKRIKTGLMQDLLTKGIDENGKIRSEEKHLFKDSKIGRIPEEWKESTIGKSVNICNQYRLPLSEIVREGMKGPFPYYGPTGVLDYINEYRVEGKFVLIGEDGDHFLKFKKQQMTILVDGKFNVNNHAHLLQGTDECTTEWVHEYFMHRDITENLTRQGAGRFKLNKAALKELSFPIPKLEEQNKIIERTSSIRKYIDQLEQEKAKLIHLKDGLMHDLLSGKIRVTNLLKEKEPAL